MCSISHESIEKTSSQISLFLMFLQFIHQTSILIKFLCFSFNLSYILLTPFFDTYLGTSRVWIGRWSNDSQSAEELPMRIVVDEEAIEYD